MNGSDVRSSGLLNVFFVAVGTICILSAILLRPSSEVISDLAINIGATLIATSLLAFLYQKLGARGLTDQIQEIQQSLTLMGKGLELGITNIWKERREIPISEWNEFTKRARHEVWLYGVAEYGYARDEVFHQILNDGTARGCSYKVLILDPESPSATYWDERDQTGIFPSKIRASFRIFQRLIEQNKGKPGKIELRVYNEVPSLNIIRADGQMLVTLYISCLRGDDSLTLQIQHTPNGLFEEYQKQFNRVWNESRKVAAS